MTDPLFRNDAYLRECEARVLGVVATDKGDAVRLDRSVFYPRAGGQPGDTGRLRWTHGGVAAEAAVADTVKDADGAPLHLLAAGAAPPPAGAAVVAALDWERRHRHMRIHTALHLLCAVMPGIHCTGNQIGADRSRLDFDLPEPPTREWLAERLNELAGGDHPIGERWIDEAELDANPGLVRTLSVQPPRNSGRIRLVRIGSEDAPVDLQPCGGTHVRRTGEIGRIVVTKLESKGRQNRRVSLVLEDVPA